MRRVHVGPNMAVFLLLLGVAFVHAIVTRNWLLLVFWLVISFLLLRRGAAPRSIW